MKFPYVKIHGQYYPIIPVTIRHDGFSSMTDALVDSGANASIFHAAYAEEIGIGNIQSGTPVDFVGISGAPVRGYRHEVAIEVGGNRFENFSIAFSHDLSPDSFNILGQEEFFVLFPIKFTFSKLEIVLMGTDA